MAAQGQAAVSSHLLLKGVSTGSFKSPSTSPRESVDRVNVGNESAASIRKVSLENRYGNRVSFSGATLPYIREIDQFTTQSAPSSRKPSTVFEETSAHRERLGSTPPQYLVNKNVGLPSLTPKHSRDSKTEFDSRKQSPAGSRRQSVIGSQKALLVESRLSKVNARASSEFASAGSWNRSYAASRTNGPRVPPTSSQKSSHAALRRGYKHSPNPTTLKQALTSSAASTGKIIRLNLDNLEGEAAHYERVLANLSDDNLKPHQHNTTGETILNDFYGSDADFVDKWMAGRDIYEPDQNTKHSQEKGVKLNRDHTRRKSQTGSVTSSIKLKKLQKSEKGLRRSNAKPSTTSQDEESVGSPRPSTQLKTTRARQVSPIRTAKQQAGKSSVPSVRKSITTELAEDITQVNVWEQDETAEVILDKLDQVINDVDSCIQTTEDIKEAGGISRTQILYTSISKLNKEVNQIKQSYMQFSTRSNHESFDSDLLTSVGTSFDTLEFFSADDSGVDWNIEDEQNTTSQKKVEDEQWDNYFHSLISEFYTLKAMVTGSVDDSDAFDKKVFAFSTDNGSCPVSWREIFSMARYNLRELVCYPNANKEQVKTLMAMENNNIYSEWQSEVMQRIKDKLNSIRDSLRMTLVKPPGGKLKAAVGKLKQMMRVKPGKSKRNSVVLDATSKGSQPALRRNAQKVLERTPEEVAALHASEEYVKALAQVKKKDYLKKKLKLLQNCRLFGKKLMATCKPIVPSADAVDPVKELLTGYRESFLTTMSKQLLRVKGRYPIRPNFVSNFTLIRTVLVDKQTQDRRKVLIKRFLHTGYSISDLTNRRFRATTLCLAGAYSINGLVLETMRVAPCFHYSLAQLPSTCNPTARDNTTNVAEVKESGKVELVKAKRRALIKPSTHRKQSCVLYGNAYRYEMSLADTELQVSFGQKQEEQFNKLQVKGLLLALQSGLVFPAWMRESEVESKHSIHRPVSPYSTKLVTKGVKRKLFTTRSDQSRDIDSPTLKAMDYTLTDDISDVNQSEWSVSGVSEIKDFRNTAQQLSTSMSVQYDSESLVRRQVDSLQTDTSSSLNSVVENEQSENDLGLSSSTSETRKSTGWTTSSSDSEAAVKSQPVLKPSSTSSERSIQSALL
ncbi:serine-rich adhesin for platelets-like [Watersipora subatra]|uniref:serine-rich adhesin for platelets-like n=1 Tax=Watersipora subatra TaxID=2589382 RepID=UPI00355C5D6A